MIKKLKYLKDYFTYLENPIEVLQFKFSLKKECEVKLKKSKQRIPIKKISSLNKLMTILPTAMPQKHKDLSKYIIEIDNDKKIICINDIKYINVYNSEFKQKDKNEYNICIEEYFSGDEWNMVNFNDRFVIDIGGNIGDTTLFFAKENATVIGFEPVKHLYDLAIENINLNPKLKNKITYINKAVGGKKGTINITSNSTNSYINDADSYDIEVITVKDVLKDYNFPSDILKMDCEGCEFEIVLNEDLTMFNDIIFEHHSRMVGKDFKPLIKKLERDGFKINKYRVTVSQWTFEEIGIIHAFK